MNVERVRFSMVSNTFRKYMAGVIGRGTAFTIFFI